jgi:ribosomal protein S18 acetylase RimI-like enzyme
MRLVKIEAITRVLYNINIPCLIIESRGSNTLKIEYKETDERNLDLIKPLWQKLLEHHRARSRNFTARYDNITFEKRKDELLKKSAGGALHIDLARDSETQALIGYCVTSINTASHGEIESIYVEPEYRRGGIGDTLMKKALKWLDERPVTRRVLAVAAGNEEVFEFYRHYKFYPRATILEQIGPD